MKPKCYDVAVLGASPAGLAAAIALGRRCRSVVVVSAPCRLTGAPLAEWVPATLFTLAPFLKRLARPAGAEPFSRVVYHNADGTQSATHRGRKALGYFLQADKLTGALKAIARAAGVRVVTAQEPVVPQLGERQVVLPVGQGVTARTLLMAQGCPADVISALTLPVRPVPVSRLAVAGMNITWTASKLGAHFGRELHVVHLAEGGELALMFRLGAALHVRLIRPAGKDGEPAAALCELVERLRRVDLLPSEMPVGRVKAAAWEPASGVAMEMDSHIAKRTLLIGSAGGFADQVTAQTVTPGVRSALLAAEVVHQALDADGCQEVLNSFKTAWRGALANYLRPPNTAVHLLMPLLFVNERMVTRFTRAMLYGDAI